MHRKLRLPAIMTLGAAMLLTCLGQGDIVTSHEARVAQTAREMAASGWPWNAQPIATPQVALVDDGAGKRLMPQPDRPALSVNPWMVPLFDGRIRLQKPPLPYWVAAGGYRLLDVGEGVARLGPALLGLLCVPLIYDLARKLISRRAGWIAALVWVSSHFVVSEFRKAMADPYLAFFTLLALWSYLRAGRSHGLIPLAYVAVGLGMLAKGPVILVHLGIVLPLYHFCYRRPAPRGRWAHFLGVVLLLAIALPWPMHVMRQVPNALDLWRYESVGELTREKISDARPWHFYLPLLAQLTLPWTAFWVVGLGWPVVRRARGAGRRRQWFLLAWYAGTVLVFSVLTSKKAAYLLPMMPAQTLMVAQGVLATLALARRVRNARSAAVVREVQKAVGLCVGVAIGAAIVLAPATWPYARGLRILNSIRNASLDLSFAGIALACLAVFTGVLPLLLGRRPVLTRWLAVQGSCYGVLLLLFLIAVELPLDNARSPRQFMRVVEAADSAPGHVLSHAGLPEPSLFYLPLWLPDEPNAEHVLAVVEDRRGEADAADPARFAAYAPGLQVLAVQRVRVPLSSPNSPWELYELLVKRSP